MKRFPKLTARDRILFLAPHPDDESLAAGGLLQRAVSAGAEVAIVFASNGDRNPWPQRAIEKKWRIRACERARWGERRRAEALVALDRLGLPRASAVMLGFPDQGFTAALLSPNNPPLAALIEVITTFQPSLFIAPSLGDRHPDHNALAVIARLALDDAGYRDSDCRLLHYVIHRNGQPPAAQRIAFFLHPHEIEQKRHAIMAHESQMILSRKRFLAYARPEEHFFQPVAASAGTHAHPIQHAEMRRGALQLRIRKTGRTWANTILLIAARSVLAGEIRWSLRLPPRSACLLTLDLNTGEPGRRAVVRVCGNMASVALPIHALGPLERLFGKVTRRSLFFDQHGWRELPARPEIPSLAPVEPGISLTLQKSESTPAMMGSGRFTAATT